MCLDDVSKIQTIRQIPEILELCCHVTGMRFSAVARVTDEKWLTCASLDRVNFKLGPGDELPLETTICQEVRQSRELVVFDDASLELRYHDHHTPRIYGLRSYISVPIITSDGNFFGTLCAIDPAPHKVNTPEIISMFKLFADLIAAQLQEHEAAASVSRALALERETARLREEFIAVVGHDLRNPIFALTSGLRRLERMNPMPEALALVKEMGRSVGRLGFLTANLMDFARGRLGQGLVADVQSGVKLDEVIAQIVTEVQTVAEREIVVSVEVAEIIACDPQRIGQMLSNLLVNALTHGAPHSPVKLEAKSKVGQLSITIRNTGETIEPALLAKLFEPFRRGNNQSQGLGLGLYISSQIAKSHGGTLSATSEDNNIAFTFTMPLHGGESDTHKSAFPRHV